MKMASKDDLKNEYDLKYDASLKMKIKDKGIKNKGKLEYWPPNPNPPLKKNMT